MEKQYPVHDIKIDDPCYPPLLRRITDPPETIYCRGDLSVLGMASVALVGARNATEYGKWVAFNMAKTLAEYGLSIVSGMAWGIDSQAHRGALAAGGKTVAVFGCGVDVCYPRTNAKLMGEILENGIVLSEFAPGTEPRPYMFPQRNRIISGLALTTAVVEAGLKSGSLITAERAAEQGRNVYAVPGNINRISSLGCNKLIQDGAMPIVVLDDIASDLKLVKDEVIETRSAKLGDDEKKIYGALRSNGEMSADELCRQTGVPPQNIHGIVSVLEMKGLVETALGKIFVAN